MSDDFNARYRLLKCVAVDDGIRTHNAQEMATGRVVMVHLADAAGPDDVERLRGQLARLTGADKNRILETATLPSGYAIVTEFIAGLASFPAWLTQKAGPAAAAAAPAPAPPTPPPVAMSPAPQPTPTAPAAPLPAATPSPEATSPGAFTLMFGKPAPPAPQPTAADPFSAPPATHRSEGKELPPRAEQLQDTATRIPTPAQPAAAVAPPAPLSPPASGVFTQMFGAPATPEQPDTSAFLKEVAPPQGQHEDTLTQVESPAAPSPAVAPTTPAAPGTFTQMFGAPAVASSAPTPVTPAVALPLLGAATPSAFPAPAVVTPAPGEFTRMFSAPATAAPMPHSMPPSPVAPPVFAPPAGAPPLSAPPAASPLASSPAPGSQAPWPPVNASPVTSSPPPLFGRPATPPGYGGANAPLPPVAPVAASPLSAAPVSATPTAPLGTPSMGTPSVLPPPIFAQGAGSTPLSPLGGAAVPSAAAGPSDFTRMISKAPAPVVPDAAPTPVTGTATSGKAAPAKRGLPTGLIVVINVVLLVAVLIVVFVLKKPAPTVPSAPAVPTAPAIPTPKT